MISHNHRQPNVQQSLRSVKGVRVPFGFALQEVGRGATSVEYEVMLEECIAAGCRVTAAGSVSSSTRTLSGIPSS
jgi:hypothetical protein